MQADKLRFLFTKIMKFALKDWYFVTIFKFLSRGIAFSIYNSLETWVQCSKVHIPDTLTPSPTSTSILTTPLKYHLRLPLSSTKHPPHVFPDAKKLRRLTEPTGRPPTSRLLNRSTRLTITTLPFRVWDWCRLLNLNSSSPYHNSTTSISRCYRIRYQSWQISQKW